MLDIPVRRISTVSLIDCTGMSYPEFPGVVEPKLVGPDTDHAPAIEQDDAECNGVKHRLGSESITLLNPPECVDADRLTFVISSVIRGSIWNPSSPAQRCRQSKDTLVPEYCRQQRCSVESKPL
jgi:hypothetical protein